MLVHGLGIHNLFVRAGALVSVSKVLLLCSLPFLGGIQASAQNPVGFQEMLDALYEQELEQVDYTQLQENIDWLLLDARELAEFEVSHIAGALFVGYQNFSIERLGKISRSSPVVVYCSVGYRSEKIGLQLQLAGFENVYNLRGGIFEWVNHNCEVVNSAGQSVKRIHPYNQKWSKWIVNHELVYE